MEIYLIRHTTPDVPQDLIYGRTEINLTANCVAETQKVLDLLPAEFDAVYSSPSGRCTYLASHIASVYKTDERLYEVNFGLWEGKTWDTVDQQELKIWMEDFVNVCPPQGESMAQMYKRVMDFWDTLLKQTYQKVAVVTHGGVIRLILAAVSNTPLAAAFGIKVNYGDVFLLNERLDVFKMNK